MDPKAQPSVSEAAKREQATSDEVQASLDLPEYPGASVVENVKLVSETLSPDEVRLELVRKSADAPDKVVKFYESNLGEKASGEPGHQEIFGRTQRGNFVRVHVDSDGSGSKFTLNVISYAKK